MTLIVEKGRGYSPAEERMKGKVVAGEIILDAIFLQLLMLFMKLKIFVMQKELTIIY
jgi:hypothetical protein